MDSLSSYFQSTLSESTGLSFIKVYNLWHKLIKDELNTWKLENKEINQVYMLANKFIKEKQ